MTTFQFPTKEESPLSQQKLERTHKIIGRYPGDLLIDCMNFTVLRGDVLNCYRSFGVGGTIILNNPQIVRHKSYQTLCTMVAVAVVIVNGFE